MIMSMNFKHWMIKNCDEEYIEYYNTQRIITKLKGLTPVQYRNQSLECVNA